LRRGPTIQTKISLETDVIYCTKSLPLSRAMEDSSIVQVQQLQILYRRRRPHTTSQLTTQVRHVVERIVVAREHRQKDGGRWLGTMLRWWNARQRPMNERRNSQDLKSTHWRTGIANV